MKTHTFLAGATALAFAAGAVALPSLADAGQTLHGGGGHGGGGYHGGGHRGGYRVGGAYHGGAYHGGRVYRGGGYGYGGGGYGGGYYLTRRLRTRAGGSRALRSLRLLKPAPSRRLRAWAMDCCVRVRRISIRGGLRSRQAPRRERDRVAQFSKRTSCFQSSSRSARPSACNRFKPQRDGTAAKRRWRCFLQRAVKNSPARHRSPT